LLSVVALVSLAFWSHSAIAAGEVCPNEAVRVEQKATRLPACRAYELVTPVDTNDAPPYALGGGSFVSAVYGTAFSSPPATADGNSFKFVIVSTAIPGLPGNGFSNGYRAVRGATGWSSSLTSPTGPEAGISGPGGFSSDGGYSVFSVGHNVGRYNGTLDTWGESPLDFVSNSNYIRYPDGSNHLVGEGTLPAEPDTDGFPNGFRDDPFATINWISASGSHMVFETRRGGNGHEAEEPVQLTSDAPADGIAAVYDRTPEGLHVVSLLPGDVTPTEPSTFQGSSADGSVVLFKTGSTLYARLHDASTVPVVSGTALPGGVSADGSKAFYSQGGNLFAFDTATQLTTQITTTGDAEFVQVSPGGSRIFFVSPSQLDGAKGISGSPNLYEWSGGSATFIATVEPSDVHRLPTNPSGTEIGLGAWAQAGGTFPANPATNLESAIETSRTTPNGSALVFESSAQLTSYDNAGRLELYLHHAGSNELTCVSCDPSGVPPTANAELLSDAYPFLGLDSASSNLNEAGDSVVFETADGLLPGDTNGVTDVYEWHAGTLSLLSSGHSPIPSFLMATTPDGANVFISTSDELVADGQEAGVRAVYDARVDGGFPVAQQGLPACGGDACQGEASVAPPATAVGSASFGGPGNVKAHRVGKHAKHHKRTRCKKKHHKCNKGRVNGKQGGSK
jgi:hypothetical protein